MHARMPVRVCVVCVCACVCVYMCVCTCVCVCTVKISSYHNISNVIVDSTSRTQMTPSFITETSKHHCALISAMC